MAVTANLKWLSRKWLMGAAGLVLGVLVLVGVLTPAEQDAWVLVAEKVVGGVLALAAVLGYIRGEAMVDAAREIRPTANAPAASLDDSD